MVQELFNSFVPGKGGAYVFLLYAALCVVSIVFVILFVPETRGMSLEEIEAMLRGTRRRG